VFALVEPDAAAVRAERLIDVARAGDFGTFTERDAARVAFAIAAYDDPKVSPLPSAHFDAPYDDQCTVLYTELLPKVVDLVEHPDRFRALWENEDAHLGESVDAIERGGVRIEERPDVDLAVVTVPEAWGERATHRFTQTWTEAVHPMAVDNATDRFRILLVQGRRYRLELRYESWVMYVSRPVLPRPDLRVLAEQLTAQEPAGARWKADAPGALTPQLRLDGNDESDIAPETFVALVEQYLATAPAAWDPFVA
jgi:hypothetical protein